MTKFIAIDGEGWADQMQLLGSSDGSTVYNELGLDFFTCADYLLSLRSRHPKHKFISYGHSWDCTHILKWFEPKARNEIIATNVVNITHPTIDNAVYRVEYVAGKWISIALRLAEKNRYVTASKTSTITIYDTMSFFEPGFIAAALQMKAITNEELPVIIKGKAKREEFGPHMLDTITEYNKTECDIMVRMAENLEAGLQSCGIQIHKWYGPGVIANHLLSKHDIDEHIILPDDEILEHAIMSAYFGGRIQAVQIGQFNMRYNSTTRVCTPYYGYDINSAYPYALSKLPSMTDCVITTCEGLTDDPVGLYHVTWECSNENPFGPLPFRLPTGSIDYPLSGSGWYWGVELRAAIAAFDTDSFVVDRGYVFNCDMTTRPFEFVNDMYDERKRRQESGDSTEMILKLALNSLYGKLAQGSTYYDKLPPYQSYIYAGICTATTRGSLLDATKHNQSDVIEFCTDGILCTNRLPINASDNLGDWKESNIDSMFVIKPGMHRLSTGKVDTTACRGYRPRELNWDLLQWLWLKKGPPGKISINTSQFVSMAMDPQHPGRWSDVPKILSFWPTHGDPEPLKRGRGNRYWTYHIEPCYRNGESFPYHPDDFVNIENIDAISELRIVYNILGEFETDTVHAPTSPETSYSHPILTR